jgi:hypothetical protein
MDVGPGVHAWRKSHQFVWSYNCNLSFPQQQPNEHTGQKTELQNYNVQLWYVWFPSMRYSFLNGWHGGKLLCFVDLKFT